MKSITIYKSNVRGLPQNIRYDNKVIVNNIESFSKAITLDYVCATYKDNIRSIKNFIKADCLPVDIDNDHAEDSSNWIYVEDVKKAFPEVGFYVQYSRHHLISKNGKKARPKFHVLFPIDEITDEAKYSSLKQKVYNYFPFIDNNALDSARFFFGTSNPQVELVEGDKTLSEFIWDKESENFLMQDAPILEGSRNSTLSKEASKIIKRYGDTADAYNEFLKISERCTPPLDNAELKLIWSSATKFYKTKIVNSPNYIKPDEYNQKEDIKWDSLIPLNERPLLPFPIDVFPDAIKNYCLAVSEATQTPIDMAGVIALSVLALSMQRKYQIQGKSDWDEPLNLYAMVVAEPSERKSAVINQMIKVIHAFEINYNEAHSLEREKSELEYQALITKRNKLVKDVEKGKATTSELDEVITKINGFKRLHKLVLTADDVTPEVLANKLKEQDESLSIISSEGGIFDVLSGAYSKVVNIDILLKGYSGDYVRVDRIGRESISLKKPKLTILLMVQPRVLETILNNPIFSGRGLNARFLYSIPKSMVGSRKLTTDVISEDTKQAFYSLINSILNEDTTFIDTISLTDDAYKELERYHDNFEFRLKNDLKDIGAWAGKLVGNILRISGLLTRAFGIKYDPFLNDGTPLVDGNYIVQKKTMLDAIKVGDYFLDHALYAFDMLGLDTAKKNAKKIVDSLIKQTPHKDNITARDVMRLVRSFKTKDEVIPALNLLCDYGYLKECESNQTSIGRPKGQSYLINPSIYTIDSS